MWYVYELERLTTIRLKAIIIELKSESMPLDPLKPILVLE